VKNSGVKLYLGKILLWYPSKGEAEEEGVGGEHLWGIGKRKGEVLDVYGFNVH